MILLKKKNKEGKKVQRKKRMKEEILRSNMKEYERRMTGGIEEWREKESKEGERTTKKTTEMGTCFRNERQSNKGEESMKE